MKLLKIIIKKIMATMGMGIYNLKTSRRQTMAEALLQIKKMSFYPTTIIDLGVAYGTKDLYETFPKAMFLLIEPLEEYKPILVSIARKYNAVFELAAASDKNGVAEINVHPDLSGSSLLKEVEDSDVNGVPRKIKTVRVDQVCKKRSLEGPFLIKVDTQGAELTALEGAEKILPDTEVIVLEVSLFRFFENGPQFFDVIKWMKDHGFVAYDLYGGQNRPLDGALAQVDMVFAKEKSFLRKNHFYATKEQRLAHTKLVKKENPSNVK